ncbi:hypothetical protein Pelo_3912 [Pelomyxa schiedti]|nr:hypothetical protein Pelo_3912 [Pelomyxa schiedti]
MSGTLSGSFTMMETTSVASSTPSVSGAPPSRSLVSCETLPIEEHVPCEQEQRLLLGIGPTASEVNKYRFGVTTRWFCATVVALLFSGCLSNYAALKPLFIYGGTFAGLCNPESQSDASFEVNCNQQVLLLNVVYLTGPIFRGLFGMPLVLLIKKKGRKFVSGLCCLCVPLLAIYGIVAGVDVKWGAQFAVLIISYPILCLASTAMRLVCHTYTTELCNTYSIGHWFFTTNFVTATTNALLDAGSCVSWFIAITFTNASIGLAILYSLVAVVLLIYMILFTFFSMPRPPPVTPQDSQTYTQLDIDVEPSKLTEIQYFLVFLLVLFVCCVQTQSQFYIAVQYELIQWETNGDLHLANEILAVAAIMAPFSFIVHYIFLLIPRTGTVPFLIYFIFAGPIWTGISLSRSYNWIQVITFFLFYSSNTMIFPLVNKLVNELLPYHHRRNVITVTFISAACCTLLFALTTNWLVISRDIFGPILVVLEAASFASLVAYLIGRCLYLRNKSCWDHHPTRGTHSYMS